MMFWPRLSAIFTIVEFRKQHRIFTFFELLAALECHIKEIRYITAVQENIKIESSRIE